MRRIATLVAVIVAVVFAFGVAQAAAPEKIVLKAKKGDITFNHKAHGEKVPECKACHHKGEAGKEQSCSAKDCHGAKTDGKKLSIQEAAHKQCKGCHDKKAPEVAKKKCDGCHAKKK